MNALSEQKTFFYQHLLLKSSWKIGVQNADKCTIDPQNVKWHTENFGKMVVTMERPPTWGHHSVPMKLAKTLDKRMQRSDCKHAISYAGLLLKLVMLIKTG